MVWHVPFRSRLAPGRRRQGAPPSRLEREASAAAEGLLADLRLGGLPIDPVAVAAALGLKVSSRSLGDEFSGALVKQAGQDAVIFFNGDEARNRQRFTVAHQLGHFMRCQEGALDSFGYVDFRRAPLFGELGDEERYANAFAAALLMPAEAIRGLRRCGLGETGMLMCFAVPREALRYRRAALGLG